MAINRKPTGGGDHLRETVEQLKRVPADEAKRLNVPVSPELMKRIKMRAVVEGRSASEITRELWVKYIEEHEE